MIFTPALQEAMPSHSTLSRKLNTMYWVNTHDLRGFKSFCPWNPNDTQQSKSWYWEKKLKSVWSMRGTRMATRSAVVSVEVRWPPISSDLHVPPRVSCCWSVSRDQGRNRVPLRRGRSHKRKAHLTARMYENTVWSSAPIEWVPFLCDALCLWSTYLETLGGPNTFHVA
jgi:hypothetical protein